MLQQAFGEATGERRYRRPADFPEEAENGITVDNSRRASGDSYQDDDGKMKEQIIGPWTGPYREKRFVSRLPLRISEDPFKVTESWSGNSAPCLPWNSELLAQKVPVSYEEEVASEKTAWLEPEFPNFLTSDGKICRSKIPVYVKRLKWKIPDSQTAITDVLTSLQDEDSEVEPEPEVTLCKD